MSAVFSGNEAVMCAHEIDARAAYWLERRNFGDWDDAAQTQLAAWLNQSTAHEVAFLRLEAAWMRTGRLAALRLPTGESAKSVPRFRMSAIVIGIAASLAIIAVVGIAAERLLQSHAQIRTFSTPVGGHELVGFADGTRIELNTNTILRAQMTTESRTVWLEHGEAYFQVKHDAAHPFTVFVGNHRISDLGTEFLVRKDTGRLEVAVEQGRVSFKASDEKAPLQTAFLSRGDAVVATADSTVMEKLPLSEIANELAWRRGILVFRHTRLAAAAAEFNRYNRKKLIVTDPDAANRVIGASFPINDVERFARVAHDVLGLHVEHRGVDIVIGH